MGLNISRGNMYSFVTHTWNAIKGECPHDCTYCYMKRWGKQNPVRLDQSEFTTDLGEGNFIFVGSSCDMFANDIPDMWILTTMHHLLSYKKNKYLLQSKNPRRIEPFLLPKNAKNFVVCTTIETNRWYPMIMKNAPAIEQRVMGMEKLGEFEKYITIEPIMDFDLEPMVELIKRCEPEQVNIGADSGGNNLPEPSMEKTMSLIEELKKFTTISKKRNLERLIPKEI